MQTTPTGSTKRGAGFKIALVGGGLAAGVIVATAIGANAATTSTTTSSTTSSTGTSSGYAATTPSGAPSGAPSGQAGSAARPGGIGGSAPVRSDEKSLGSALTAKLRAAALKAVPGGTVVRIESDSGDATYEAHMTKANGSTVTVKFDKSGTVTSVEQGMGK